MRRGEILALTVSDIIKNAIFVGESLYFKNNKGVIKETPKTNAGYKGSTNIRSFEATVK